MTNIDPEVQKAYVRESLRKRRKLLKMAGYCVDCSNAKAEENHTLCWDCMFARREREDRRRANPLPPSKPVEFMPIDYSDLPF